ncbi:hypothetical protein DYB34_008176 [Aphanomyces astaci]|uniref:PWWP domain-containing protein n=5 Tax=Aphanomyces astaci TaxID=112090 RepID=A0A418C8Y6_APHAT|nr:hypothetical protein DYB34_008176 [Aphanomyces astaci]
MCYGSGNIDSTVLKPWNGPEHTSFIYDQSMLETKSKAFVSAFADAVAEAGDFASVLHTLSDQPANSPPTAPLIPSAEPPRKKQALLTLPTRSNQLISEYVMLRNVVQAVVPAWKVASATMTLENLAEFTKSLQIVLNQLHAIMRKIIDNPRTIVTPLVFVSTYHSAVMCVWTMVLSVSLKNAAPASRSDTHFMHTCLHCFLESVDGVYKPLLHSSVVHRCLQFAHIATQYARAPLAPEVQRARAWMHDFFQLYLAKPPTYDKCRALVADTTSGLGRLPVPVTRELAKLTALRHGFEHPAVDVEPAADNQQEASMSFHGQSLGLHIGETQNGLRVLGMTPTAPEPTKRAVQSGTIQRGDVIVAVNSIPIAQFGGFRELCAVVASTARPIVLTFRRRPGIRLHDSDSRFFSHHLKPAIRRCMTTASPVAFDTMAWVLTDGHPWWPVYVINPAHIPPELKAFGQLERESAETANADDTRVHLVFNFGRHTLSVHNMDAMKAWNCTQHPTLLQGYPMSAFRKRGNIAEFRDAMKEAMVFDAEDIATRRLPLSEPHSMDKENQDPSTPNRELVSAKADGDLPGPVCTVDITSPTGPSLTTPIHGDDNDECHISLPPPSQPSDGGIELPPQGVALGSKANASLPPFLAVPDEPCTTTGAPQVEPSPVDASDLPPREGPLECPNVVDEPVASSSATDDTAHADVSDTVATPHKSDSADEATITQNNEEEVDGMLLAGTPENDGTVITEIVSSLVDRVIAAVLPMSSKEDDEEDAIAGKQADPSDDVALDTARISLPDQGYSSSRPVAPAPPERDDAAEEESGEIAATGHLVDAPISSPTTADQTKASMGSSSPVGKPAAPVDQFANALADPELMAMADILGISIEAHTPTQQPSVTASSSSVAIASTKAVSQAVSTGESTGSPVGDSMGVDTMAWVKRGAGPWWPAYVCDPTTVRQKLKLSGTTQSLEELRRPSFFVGPNHNMMLYRATTHPDIRLVYFFGLNKLGSTKLSARRIKAWNCAEQNALMFPPISHLESKATLDAFRAAVTEAQAYVDSYDKVLPALSTAAHAAEATPTKRSLDATAMLHC